MRQGPKTEPNAPASLHLPESLLVGPESWTSPEGLSSTIQVMLVTSVLSLAPAVLLMTTCFVRIVVVLSLLRQAIGAQQLPPNQVMTSISLFLTLVVMAPVGGTSTTRRSFRIRIGKSISSRPGTPAASRYAAS